MKSGDRKARDLARLNMMVVLGEPTAPLLCLASISCPHKVLSSTLVGEEKNTLEKAIGKGIS